jgi:hypothetical protein
VTRVEAFDYVLRYAKRFPGLERGEFAAYAALASSILYSEEAEFAAVRKAKKGGGNIPDRNCTEHCAEAERACGCPPGDPNCSFVCFASGDGVCVDQCIRTGDLSPQMEALP